MNQGIKIPILDLHPQYEALENDILSAIKGVLKSTAFIMGPDVKIFETEVANYLGVKNAVGVNSGTDALVIGLRAAGIGEGDEVITTPFSFFATAEAISHVGARPVFADIDEKTFNISPTEIRKKITPKTRGILPVHLFGRAAPMEEITAIAKEHNLKIIEDCAQSFGARYQGRQTGTFGTVGAFSFFPSKNLGACGDGGLISTNNDAIADTARMLRAHGSKKKYYNEVLGYNSRLDTIQASILRVKLPYVDRWNKRRREIAGLYNELLADVRGLTRPEIHEGHVFHQYTIRVLGGKRDELIKFLEDAGVSTMIYYPVPQNQLPVYKGQYPATPISDLLAQEALSLPIWPEMSQETIEYIASTLKKVII